MFYMHNLMLFIQKFTDDIILYTSHDATKNSVNI